MKFEVGTHQFRKQFNCLECAKRYYLELKEKKYLKNNWKNKILLNTYGWENDFNCLECEDGKTSYIPNIRGYECFNCGNTKVKYFKEVKKEDLN